MWGTLPGGPSFRRATVVPTIPTIGQRSHGGGAMVAEERAQVAIVGAGPAGLVLSHLLHLAGVESVVLEAHTRDYVEHRVRAGVLEHPTAELLDEVGVGQRMRREGLEHEGIALRFDGTDHRIDFRSITGRSITVDGHQEL